MNFSPRLLELMADPLTRVCVLTGAGVSAESGVPTFRDPGGLWQKFKPEELASMPAFLRNPELVQGWYEHRRQVIRDVSPNAGHLALVEMENHFERFTLVTQNVDGLHRRAGSKEILEVHGNIMRSLCVDCSVFCVADAPSRCAECGGLMRPDVVWFGEMLPEDIWEASQRAAGVCDLFFSVGTSAAVYPAAGLPSYARSMGAYVVEINPVETPLVVDESLRGPSAVVLPALWKASSAISHRSPT